MKSKPAATFAPSSGYPGSSSFPGSAGYPGSQPFPSSPGFPSTPASQTYQPSVPQQTSSSSKQKFTSVIDKCSNILSFYPKSSVVDDALFLIGKSYFYQDEFVRAERKFSELIVQDPNGSLSLGAQLWLLKTFQRLIRLDDANRVGNDLVDAATKAEKNEVTGEALEILGDVAVAQQKPEAAIELYAKAVAVSDNGSIRATAQAKIGDTYTAGGQYDKAASAYGEVWKYSPDPYGLYSSQLQTAIAYRRIGQYDTTIYILRKLESDYRFMDFWGTIRFELATTFAANHKLDDAVDLYRLVDTTYARTEQGARAAFELGRLLQLQMGDYANAKIAFTHATVGGPQDLTQEAQRRATAFDKYFRLSDQFLKLDSIYFIADIDSLWMKVDSATTNARKATADSLALAARIAVADSLALIARRRTLDSLDLIAKRKTVDSLSLVVKKGMADSLALNATRRSLDSLTLIAKRASIDSSAISAKRDSSDDSRQTNVSRRDVAVAVLSADATTLKSIGDTADTRLNQLPMILVKPRKDTLVASLGNISYQLGELFYTDLDVPDSTFLWLNQALKLGLDSVKSVRALFVLAEVARANPEKKYGDEKDLYRQIVAKYAKSSYAEQARIALGFPPTPKKEDPAAAMFAVAESLMYAGKYQPAIDSLGRIARDYPESLLSPKSRFTMAWIYEHNLANPDSALSQYKVLAAKHANTKYGEAAQRRIPPVVADTSKRTTVEPMKKSAADTAGRPQFVESKKATADTTTKFPPRSTAQPDSLSKNAEFDERPLQQRVPRDTASVRKIKKEVIE